MLSKKRSAKQQRKILRLDNVDTENYSDNEGSPMKMEKSLGNIFADLGFDAAEAANLQVRARRMSRLIDFIEEKGFTQQEAANFFGVKQPRISNLMRGKINEFSIDALVNLLAIAGLHISIDFEPVGS